MDASTHAVMLYPHVLVGTDLQPHASRVTPVVMSLETSDLVCSLLRSGTGLTHRAQRRSVTSLPRAPFPVPIPILRGPSGESGSNRPVRTTGPVLVLMAVAEFRFRGGRGWCAGVVLSPDCEFLAIALLLLKRIFLATPVENLHECPCHCDHAR
jgi:hypothetical protein